MSDTAPELESPASTGLFVKTPRASLDLPLPMDRLLVQSKGTRRERLFYHHLARQTNAGIVAERERLGQAYLAEHRDQIANPGFRIDRATGVTPLALAGIDALKPGLDQARRFVENTPPDADLPSKRTMDYIVSAEDKLNWKDNRIDYHSPMAKLAMDPNILVPVIDYLGAAPILFALTVSESKNAEFFNLSSQMWHLDPEDVTQIKVFTYLYDVDEDTGPFTALGADDTDRIFAAKPEYGVGRLADEDVVAVLGGDRKRVFTGPADTAVFCDTTRCLHYGSRPGAKRRHILFLMYVLPTSTWFPLVPGDGEPFTYVSRLQDEAASPMERAILGMDLVPR